MASREELQAIVDKYMKDDRYHEEFEFRYNAMKLSAKLGNKNFDPSIEYKERLRKLLLFPTCIYCGKTNGNKSFMSIGCNVPSDNYTIANSVPCCSSCNKFKGSLTGQEYISKLRDFKKLDQKNHPLLKNISKHAK